MIGELEVVVAEDLGLDAQALCRDRARRRRPGSHSCIIAQDALGVLGVDRHFPREVFDA